MINKLIVIVLLVIPLNAFAGNTTAVTTITGIYTYGMDVGVAKNTIMLNTASTTLGCEAGFWISADDSSNNKNIPALLLSAFHAKTEVYLAAYTHELWPGSTSSKFCKVHSVGIRDKK